MRPEIKEVVDKTVQEEIAQEQKKEEEKEILVTDISFWEFYFHDRIVRLYWISFIYCFRARHWQKRRGSTSNHPK